MRAVVDVLVELDSWGEGKVTVVRERQSDFGILSVSGHFNCR